MKLYKEFEEALQEVADQAQETLDTGSEEAERAIIYLYQLDKMDELCRQVDSLIHILCREYSVVSRALELKMRMNIWPRTSLQC